MKKSILTACLLLALPLAMWAENEHEAIAPSASPAPSVPILSRFYYGGSFGLSFNNGTSIMIQPMVGFRLTNNFSVGMNLYYEYENYNYTSNAVGIGPFARYEMQLVPKLFGLVFHGEYDFVSRRIKYDGSNTWQTSNIDRMPLGAGIYINTGARGRLSILALWDVLNLNNDSYNNTGAPTLRIGYSF